MLSKTMFNLILKNDVIGFHLDSVRVMRVAYSPHANGLVIACQYDSAGLLVEGA